MSFRFEVLIPSSMDPLLVKYVEKLYDETVACIPPNVPLNSPYCMVWTKAKSNGYAKHRVPQALKKYSTSTYVHRFLFEVFNEPAGNLTVDHSCARTDCVNIYHLRLLPREMNDALGDHQKIWRT